MATFTLTAVSLDGETLKRLQKAAHYARYWRAERDLRIRAAHEAGGGLREIARATGLSHPAILRIVRLGESDDPAEKGARNEELNKRRAPSREEPTS
jgi:hypothetical protein